MTDIDPKNDIEIKSPSRAGSLIGVLLILATIVGYFFFTKPMGANVSTIEADISSKTTEIETIQEQISTFETAEEELGISSEVQKLESLRAIPAEMNQDEVIKDIINITEIYDIELRSLSFGKGSSPYEGVDSLRINASFEGNYNDLVSFLEGIEQNPRLFKIESINVQISELEILSIQRASFSLSFEAFYTEVN